MDEWLARMVAARAVKKACLKVVLTGWQEDNSNWEGYFPEFRRAGGELRRESHDLDHLDPFTIWDAENWRNGS